MKIGNGKEGLKPELVALGVTESFKIVVSDNGAKREYLVHYNIEPNGSKSLVCVADGRACFVDGLFCTAPTADYEQIKGCLAEHLKVSTAELLDQT